MYGYNKRVDLLKDEYVGFQPIYEDIDPKDPRNHDKIVIDIK